MLTAHALNPESLKRSIKGESELTFLRINSGDRPFLECVLGEDYWRGWGRLMKNLEGYFGAVGEVLEKSEEKFWREFDEKPL
jgi:hypothetical protein